MKKDSLNSKLTWFLGEFAVVVTGVLVALALNAWWQGRQDRSFERQYVDQLEQDIVQTIAGIEGASDADARSDRALTMLIRAYRTDPAPPRDSLLRWSINAPNVVLTAPILGTAETIVSSGDLRLIRDDSLRLSLPSFLESSKELAENMALFGRQFVDGARALTGHIDYYGVLQEALPKSLIDSLAIANPMFPLPADARMRQMSGDVAEILNSLEAYQTLSYMHTVQRNLDATRDAILDEHRTMLERVQVARGE